MAEENVNGSLFPDDDQELDLDIKVDIRFSRKDHPEGKMVPITVEGKEEYILIPLNIKDGTTIEINGRGKHNPRSGKTGKLIVEIHIKEKDYPWKKWVLLVASVAVVAVVFFALGNWHATPSVPEEPTCAHIWTPADCVSPKTCSSCGETIGSPAGHEWLAATCISPKTCTICGDTSGTVLEHQWQEATYSSPKTCSVCQATEGESLRNPLTEVIRAKLPIVTFSTSNEQKVNGYEDADLTQECIDYYFKPATDELVITDISDDGRALEVRYPSSLTSSGYRTLWFPFDTIISLTKIDGSPETADDKTETLRYSQSNVQMVHYGTMDARNKYIDLGESSLGYTAIIYSIYGKTIYDVDVHNKLAFIK